MPLFGLFKNGKGPSPSDDVSLMGESFFGAETVHGDLFSVQGASSRRGFTTPNGRPSQVLMDNQIAQNQQKPSRTIGGAISSKSPKQKMSQKAHHQQRINPAATADSLKTGSTASSSAKSPNYRSPASKNRKTDYRGKHPNRPRPSPKQSYRRETTPHVDSLASATRLERAILQGASEKPDTTTRLSLMEGFFLPSTKESRGAPSPTNHPIQREMLKRQKRAGPVDLDELLDNTTKSGLRKVESRDSSDGERMRGEQADAAAGRQNHRKGSSPDKAVIVSETIMKKRGRKKDVKAYRDWKHEQDREAYMNQVFDSNEKHHQRGRKARTGGRSNASTASTGTDGLGGSQHGRRSLRRPRSKSRSRARSKSRGRGPSPASRGSKPPRNVTVDSEQESLIQERARQKLAQEQKERMEAAERERVKAAKEKERHLEEQRKYLEEQRKLERERRLLQEQRLMLEDHAAAIRRLDDLVLNSSVDPSQSFHELIDSSKGVMVSGTMEEDGIECTSTSGLLLKTIHTESTSSGSPSSAQSSISSVSISQPPGKGSPSRKPLKCIVCAQGERTHIAVPCMHCCFCVDCVKSLSKTRANCPVCDQKNVSFREVRFEVEI